MLAPTIPTARFVRSSPSWSARRGSRQTIPPSNASTSWKRSSPWAHPAASSDRAAICCAAVDPVRERYPPLALSPRSNAAGRSRHCSINSRVSPPATDPALVRGCAVGGCHFPRATRSDCRADAPTTGPCTVHLPARVRAALGWSPQRRDLTALGRPTATTSRKHGRAGDGRPHCPPK